VKRSRPQRFTGHSALWVTLAVGVILVATLPPQPEWTLPPRFFLGSLFATDAGAWRDVLQNVALYAPLGFTLAARGRPPARAALFGAVLSSLIELLQFGVPGRSATIRDVITNAAGTWGGALAFSTYPGEWIQRLFAAIERRRARARHDVKEAVRTQLGWAAMMVVVFVATATLLRPSLPGLDWWLASPMLDVSSGGLRIGSRFVGSIDEVRIYALARDEQTIQMDVQRPLSGAPADSSLVAGFDFESSSESKVPDVSGRGHAAGVRGGRLTPEGRFGAAMSFDGSSQLVVPYADDLNLRDAFTLEAWVRPAAQTRAEPLIVGREGSLYYIEASSAIGALRAASGGRFGGVPRFARMAAPLETGRWSHIASTYDGQVIRLYVDGNLVARQVHWSPHRASRLAFRGVEPPPGRIADYSALSGLRNGQLELDLSIVCGRKSTTVAPVTLMTAPQDTEVLTISAGGDDLFVDYWSWSRRLRLASVPVRLHDALRGCSPGHTIGVRMAGALQHPTVTIDERPQQTLSAGIGAGWQFLCHTDLMPAWVGAALTWIWLGALAFPLGRYSRRITSTALAAALVGVSCLVIPWVFSVRAPTVGEAAALLCGAAVGGAYSLFSARTNRAGEPKNNPPAVS
jgi:hypothetical protein